VRGPAADAAAGEGFWAMLKHSPDPRVRSYMIHRLSPWRRRRGNRKAVWTRERTDVAVRCSELGEFGDQEFPTEERQACCPSCRRSTTPPAIQVCSRGRWMLRHGSRWRG